MNKLVFDGDIIKKKILDDSISLDIKDKNEIFNVNNIIIKVLKDTHLELEYKSKEEYKININIYLNSNVTLNLFDKKEGSKSKIQYKYDLLDNSKLILNKFYDCEALKEQNIINLNGINASVDYYHKTISKNKEDYNVMVYHNADYTESNINNEGVNIENGELRFNVTSAILDNVVGCKANQVGRIINLTDNQCSINPNLLIENNEVEANHSAAIGKFSDEEIFYLMSRGIDYNTAISLLIKGFLIGSLTTDEKNIKYIQKIIDKYWR
jgi:hypothetical protein